MNKYPIRQAAVHTFASRELGYDAIKAIELGLPADTPLHVTMAHERGIFARALAQDGGLIIPDGLSPDQAMDHVVKENLLAQERRRQELGRIAGEDGQSVAQLAN